MGNFACIGYADPPYIGCAHLYKDHPDFAGEVDHVALIERLESEFDGWVLHASATPSSMAILAPLVEKTDARWCGWMKGFAAFKANVTRAWAWEPVIFSFVRARPRTREQPTWRDFVSEPIAMRRGFPGGIVVI